MRGWGVRQLTMRAFVACGFASCFLVACASDRLGLGADEALSSESPSGQTRKAATPRAHHTPDGFKNNYIGAVEKPFLDLLRWKWDAFWDDLPRAPKTPTPTQTPDLALIHANAKAGKAMQPLVTWIGHASTLVQASGLNVLTDPIFSERASPVQLVGPKRQQPPGVALKDLPPIDVVVISHNHYDHLDRQSVFDLDQRAKAADPAGHGRTLFLVPLGLKAWLADLGISNVVELDWWDKHTVKGPHGGQADFYLTPVQHWSARGLNDRSKTLWGGWSVMGEDFRWYFSGDTGYSKDFADTKAFFDAKLPAVAGPSTSAIAMASGTPSANNAIADKVEKSGGDAVFDLALLAVGAYEPRWFMAAQHINPHEAAQIHKDLGAAKSIGIHWGTFNLTDEALDRPLLDLTAAKRALGLADDAFFVLKIGQSRRFERRKR